MTDLTERLLRASVHCPWRAGQPAPLLAEAAAALQSAEARNRVLVEALEPFAKFRLEGFEGEVLEIVPSSAENPARRIEPIWASHFRRASEAFAKTKEVSDG